MRATWLNVGGRRVKLYAVDPVNGRQSVNVCTAANRPGQYEHKFYFAKGQHVTILPGRYATVDALKKDMWKKQYKQARDM